MTARARKGVSVGWLLLGVSSLILVLPIGAFLVARIFQTHLVRQTESSLISQSVLIGELYRDRWLEQKGSAPGGDVDVKPPSMAAERYAPIDPRLELGGDVLEPLGEPSRWVEDRSGPSFRAGRRIEKALVRARTFNLSSARVLDTQGCVVAASGEWIGACFSELPEVNEALAGAYSSVARKRVSDSPEPPLESISRGGDVRVFTATPVFSDGEVMAVVWMSRTSVAPIKAAWLYRKPLLIGLIVVLLITSIISLFMARSITRPLKQITRAAESVARGGAPGHLDPEGFAPAEVHALGGALSTMTDQLSGRAEYIAEFAANVSHELKSPITAIRGATELLREEMDQMPASQRERFLTNIEADSARMERLVNRLLELAKIQSAPEMAEDVELVGFLEAISDSYEDTVTLDASRCPEAISINRDHLESAVRNLLDNAITHGGGGRVDLVVADEDGRVAISVSDTGDGIDEKNRDRIFDRFFTTERDSGGTGLGLAIVKAVAVTRGGEVRVQTGPDGSTFTLIV